MSHHTTNTHTAGGLEGLALGAPIGGGSAPSSTAAGLISSTTGSAPVGNSGLTTGSSTHGTGIGSGQGLTGSSSHTTGTSTQPGAYDSNAHNSTSGERGIGGGRGGPTAFESDASRVGTTGGAGDHGHIGHSHGSDSHSHSHSHGITGPTGTGAGDDKAAIKALSGAGHHDQSRVGQYDSGATTGTHGSHGHGLAAAGAGAGLAGVGAGAAGLASHGHRGGEVDDSVTGQEHFRSSVGEQTTGNVPRAATLTSSGAGVGHGTATSTGAPVASGGSGAGFGAGTLAGAGAAGVGAGAAAHHGSSSHGSNNPIKELKQELKEHQSAPGYDKAEHHTETDGPHGLVWHNGKYVHKRELEGKGSTGVPLK